jgi:aminomethyltransferase
LAEARPYRVLEAGSAPGALFEFVAPADLVLVVAAPGNLMAPDEQTPATELHVEIDRADGSAPDLPAPLAAVTLDLRVPAAQARAYRVRAGDYIQIIDVEGRQCSDFLAFDAAQLADGIEKGLDPTTTRTLMGSAYPGPGLHSRYFDEDMRALVEVVRDTVGRHDTFALACSPKYYDDAGYPGHPNCSDNFNEALKPFGVKARKGWPAINFFYNTCIETSNALTLDEPWSRPGDYVLLRALTDLVCSSSSCADDIDPANGWNPTDIHIRVYDGNANFSKGSALRMTPDAEPRLTRESAFHPRLQALTRNFIDYRGFWLPSCFTGRGAIEEYWACREHAAIMDLSALRKFEVIGPDAEQLLQRTMTRNIAKLAVGQVVYTALCYDHGGMIDDATVMRLGLSNFRVIAGEDFTGLWLRQRAEEWGLKVWVKSSTDQLHNLAVQGPKSREILSQVIWTPPSQASLAELKWFRFTIGRIGVPSGPPVVVSRTGYTGELGYEVWCHPKDATAVWDAIWAAGQPLGLSPLGFDALDMLRIEAGLVFANYDFSDQTDPFEAGIGFTVAEKDVDFVGREALQRRKANPARKLVGLDLDGNETIGHGDPVFVGRAQVGVVTSATRSPILKKTIALCRMDMAHAVIGTAVEIGKLDGHQKRLAACVVAFPHFDPQKTRVRA